MVKIIFIILFIILGATFCTLNQQEISLTYFFGWQTRPFPLYFLILISLIAGMVMGFSTGWGKRRKLRTMARELGEQIKVLKADTEPQTSKAEHPEPSTKSTEAPKPPPV